MRKSTHSPEYGHLCRLLVALRQKAGLTQRQLAARLDREHSFVWRIETGERRLDVVEFYWVCQALEANAPSVFRTLFDAIDHPTLLAREPNRKLLRAAEARAKTALRVRSADSAKIWNSPTRAFGQGPTGS